MRFLALLLLAQLCALDVAFAGNGAPFDSSDACVVESPENASNEMHAQAPWDLRGSILLPTLAGLQAPTIVGVAPKHKAGFGGIARADDTRLSRNACAATHNLSDALPIVVAARGALRPYYPTAPPRQD